MTGSGIHFEWRRWHDWAMGLWAVWQGYLNASFLHDHVTGAWFHVSAQFLKDNGPGAPDVFAIALFFITILAWWWGYDTAIDNSRRKVMSRRALRRRQNRRR